MNSYQLAKQIEYILAAHAWAEGAQELVFANVVPTQLVTEDLYANLINGPFAIVSLGSETPDDEKPNYTKQIFRITYGTTLAGDRFGKASLVGSGRTGGVGSSKGRGILELRTEVSRALRRLQEDSGIKIVLRGRGTPETDNVEKGYLIAQTQEFEAQCVETAYYHPPERAVASDVGGGVTLTWLDPPDRWDKVTTEGIMIRRATGSTPPATTSAGTLVAEVDLGTETYTDTPLGADTYSYSLFAAYNEQGGTDKDFYSDGPAGEEGMNDTVVVV